MPESKSTSGNVWRESDSAPGAPLAPGDLARLEAVLDLLLRPLEHDGFAEWSARVCRAAEGICGVAGATAALAAGGAPRLVLSFAGPPGPAALRRWTALERLLAPAVRAGAAAWARREGFVRSIARAVDASSTPTFLCTPEGRLLHGNAASAGLPDIVEGAGTLREQVRTLARRAGSGARGGPEPREPGLPGSGWVLRATLLPEPGTGEEPLVLVSVERRAPAALSDRELRERFRLTDREVEVARLLAEGLSNAEIAGRLRISPFTARNHVENTMGKLGVPRRSRVGPLLANREAVGAKKGRSVA